MIDADALKETLIGTLQRVDERSEAEEEAETLALLADPQHMHMSEQELVRALQSDRDGGQGGALLIADGSETLSPKDGPQGRRHRHCRNRRASRAA